MTDAIEPWVMMKAVQEHCGVRCELIVQPIGNRNVFAYKVGKQSKLKLNEIDEWNRSGGVVDDERTAWYVEEDVDA